MHHRQFFRRRKSQSDPYTLYSVVKPPLRPQPSYPPPFPTPPPPPYSIPTHPTHGYLAPRRILTSSQNSWSVILSIIVSPLCYPSSPTTGRPHSAGTSRAEQTDLRRRESGGGLCLSVVPLITSHYLPLRIDLFMQAESGVGLSVSVFLSSPFIAHCNHSASSLSVSTFRSCN